MASKKPTLTEIADRINAHLKRFEADPVINARDPKYGVIRYYQASAYQGGGRYVVVRYVSFQGGWSLTRERAERYLAWLDAGYVGTHYKAEREEATRG